MAQDVQAVVSGWELAKIALTSGVVAALAGGGLLWLKEHLMRKTAARQDAEIAAIKLIASLDALGAKCLHDLQDYERVSEQLIDTENEGKHALCDLPSFDLDGSDLSKIDRKIASELIWLNNEILLARDLIRSRWNYDAITSREAAEQHTNLVGAYGYKAILASSGLRKKYSLIGINSMRGMQDVVSSLAVYSEAADEFQSRKK